MKLRLKRPARINCKAGEIVEVSPEQARFLLATDAAEIVVDRKPKPKTNKEQ